MKKSFEGEHVATPKYGENPWQASAGLFRTVGNTDPLAIPEFELIEGAEPSQNNYLDIDRLLQTATHIAAGLRMNGFGHHNIALGVKHGNVCGASIDDDSVIAVEQVMNGDKIAIHGGAVMLNFPVSADVASALREYGMEDGRKRLLDVVVSPSVDDSAVKTFERKGGKLRLMTNPALEDIGSHSLDTEERIRPVRGGFIVQENYTYVPDLDGDDLKDSGGEFDPWLERNLILAWAIGSTSNSNTITLVRDGMLIANGVGQQDRVSAARLAVEKAKRQGHDTNGAVAYSDSFFPFKDGPQVLVDAGVKAVFTTSGSVNDGEVFDTFKNGGVRVVSVPDKVGRGFYGH